MSQEKLSFHDRIAKLCLEHFNKLPKGGKPNNNEWTILSCIVQENNDQLEVVALGTGTKCIGYNRMSPNGDILNDSHAEVICRRAFLRYIYECMLFDSSFLKFDVNKQQFLFTNDSKFHFFTTHTPCGDAAIFGKDNMEHFGDVLVKTDCNDEDLDGVEIKRRKLEEQKQKDIYRTGAKCLETDTNQDLKLPGPEYHVTGVVRTKPGRGIRTLSVSCSDKIAKWCHLGIQGALLSILLEKPIFLNNFVLAGGTPYNKEAMERAFFNRLGSVSLKSPYQKNRLTFSQSNLTFGCSKSNEKRPCPTSIIWTKTNVSSKQVEVAVDGKRQGVTKKQMNSGVLRISKRELFKYFLEVVKKYKIHLQATENLMYKEAKLLSKPYQESWNILKSQYFKVWTIKNDNLLNFKVE